MPKINVNDIELDYEDTGRGNALVFLHGLGSTKEDWAAQVPFFSGNYRVITPDMRGHGASEKPENAYGVPFMAEDIKQLLDALSIEKATLIGFSMGGAVAFQFAYDYPGRLEKLVIVNSGPDFNAMGKTGEDMLAHRTAFLKTNGLPPLAREIAHNMFPEPHQETMRNAFEARCARNDLHAYYNAFVTLMHWGLGDKKKDIKTKTLIIASDMDYTPVAFKENYIKHLPNATLTVIKNSRHGVVIDQPEAFNKELYNFLKDG